jgi:mono/diheme cytochrome c family protein
MRELALITIVIVGAACAEPETVPVTVEPEHVPLQLTPELETGRVIYETVCWTCHGPYGRGDGPAVRDGTTPAPPSLQTEGFTATAERLRQAIEAGLEQGDPLYAHMQFVMDLINPERLPEVLAFLPVLAYPPEIPGSTLAGEALYALRCAGCHGADGRGTVSTSEFVMWASPPDFRTDTLVAARNWDGVFERIREGGRLLHRSPMPAWGLAFSDSDIWDLVAYIATFQPGVLSEPTW